MSKQNEMMAKALKEYIQMRADDIEEVHEIMLIEDVKTKNARQDKYIEDTLNKGRNRMNEQTKELPTAYLDKWDEDDKAIGAKVIWGIEKDRKEVHLIQAKDDAYENPFTLFSEDGAWGGQLVDMPMSIEDIKSLHKVLGDTLWKLEEDNRARRVVRDVMLTRTIKLKGETK